MSEVTPHSVNENSIPVNPNANVTTTTSAVMLGNQGSVAAFLGQIRAKGAQLREKKQSVAQTVGSFLSSTAHVILASYDTIDSTNGDGYVNPGGNKPDHTGNDNTISAYNGNQGGNHGGQGGNHGGVDSSTYGNDYGNSDAWDPVLKEDCDLHVADTINGPSYMTLDVFHDGTPGMLNMKGEFHSYEDILSAVRVNSVNEHFAGLNLDQDLIDKLNVPSVIYLRTKNGGAYFDNRAELAQYHNGDIVGGFNTSLTPTEIQNYDKQYPGFKIAYNQVCNDLNSVNNYLDQNSYNRGRMSAVMRDDVKELIKDASDHLDKGLSFTRLPSYSDKPAFASNPIINYDDPISVGTATLVDGISTGEYLDKKGNFNFKDAAKDGLGSAIISAAIGEFSAEDWRVVTEKTLTAEQISFITNNSDVVRDAMDSIKEDEDVQKALASFLSDPEVVSALNNVKTPELNVYLNKIGDNVNNPMAIMELMHDPKCLDSMIKCVDDLCNDQGVQNAFNKYINTPEFVDSVIKAADTAITGTEVTAALRDFDTDALIDGYGAGHNCPDCSSNARINYTASAEKGDEVNAQLLDYTRPDIEGFERYMEEHGVEAEYV